MSSNNDYHDNSFNLYQAYSYTLLLQVGITSFSYAIVQKNRLLVSAQNCDLNELAHPDQLAELLSATYKRVIIGMPATGLTLIPASLFSEEHIADFARFLDVKDDEKVLAQSLDNKNTIIYKTNATLITAVERFGLQNVYYTSKGWAKAIADSTPASSNLYIEVGDNTLHFLYFSSGSLRFYNTFEFSNEDELAYFTSFVAEELKLKPQDTTLVLSGDLSSGDKNITRLSEFFPKTELNNLQVLELPGQVTASKILALAALSLCGSSEVN